MSRFTILLVLSVLAIFATASHVRFEESTHSQIQVSMEADALAAAMQSDNFELEIENEERFGMFKQSLIEQASMPVPSGASMPVSVPSGASMPVSSGIAAQFGAGPEGVSFNKQVQELSHSVCSDPQRFASRGPAPFDAKPNGSPLPIDKILDRYWPDVAHDATFLCAQAILSSPAFAPSQAEPQWKATDIGKIKAACSNGVGIAHVQLSLRQMSTSVFNPCDSRLKKVALYFTGHPLLSAIFTEAFLLTLDMAKAAAGDQSVLATFKQHLSLMGLKISAPIETLLASAKGASTSKFESLAKIVQGLTDQLKEQIPELRDVLSRMEEARARRAAAAQAEETMLSTPLGKQFVIERNALRSQIFNAGVAYFESGRNNVFKEMILASPFGTSSSLAAALVMLQSRELPGIAAVELCNAVETWKKLMSSPSGQNFACLNSLTVTEYAEVAEAADKITRLNLNKVHSLDQGRLVQLSSQYSSKYCAVNMAAAKQAVEQQKRAERIVGPLPTPEALDAMCPLDERRNMLGKPSSLKLVPSKSLTRASFVELVADLDEEELDMGPPVVTIEYQQLVRDTANSVDNLAKSKCSSTGAGIAHKGLMEFSLCFGKFIDAWSPTTKQIDDCAGSSAMVMVNLKNRLEDPATDLKTLSKIEQMMKFFEINKLVHHIFSKALLFSVDFAAANGQYEALFASSLQSWSFKPMQADTIASVKAAEAKKSAADALAAFIKHLETQTNEPARSAITALSTALSKEAATGVLKAEFLNSPIGKEFQAIRAEFRASISPELFRARAFPHRSAGLSFEMLDFLESSSKSSAVSKAMVGKCDVAIKLGNVWLSALKTSSGFFDAEAASTLLWQRAVDTADAAVGARGSRFDLPLPAAAAATSSFAVGPKRPSR